mgnify:CR=1 FL=1
MVESEILDNIDNIRRIDREDMIGHCLRFADYCEESLRLSENFISEHKELGEWSGRIKNLVICGMGGSAIGGDLIKALLKDECPLPIQVYRDYRLPKYVGHETLFFAVSYSGNTVETLNSFVEAIKRGSMVISVTSNGKLSSYSQRLNAPLLKIPEGLPPRAALPYLFIPILMILNHLGLTSNSKKMVVEAMEELKALKETLKPDSPIEKNESKRLACEVYGKIPLILGFGVMGTVAHRYSTQFNENSKILSLYNFFPEFNHNLIMAWKGKSVSTEDLVVIILRDPDEEIYIKELIETARSLALSRRSKVLEVTARGKQNISKVLSAILIGDLASVYLAILRGVDPTPVKLIERLKGQLKRIIDLPERIEREIEKLLEKDAGQK